MAQTHYVSTRSGTAPDVPCDPVTFDQALRAGLAPDGGLYVPTTYPALPVSTWEQLRGRPYTEVAHAVLQPLVEPAMLAGELKPLIDRAYATFRHAAIAPLKQLDERLWLLELFHGPTLAFKDVAMRLLAQMFEAELERRDERVLIIGATSGDTGGAAIDAFAGLERCRICILHPKGRTSDVQRRQMTTVTAANVLNLAVEGTFDDCQDIVKALFVDMNLRDHLANHGAALTGVNSINFARLAPQVVYYVTASLALGGPERIIDFSVPTGNFGDVFAGYIAKQMGLPLGKLVVASNQNDILTRAMTHGDHTLTDVHATHSPSMDIQVASNFERLLFDLVGRNTGKLMQKLDALKSDRAYTLEPALLDQLRHDFAAVSANEDETLDTIRRIHADTGEIIDPHTAVGVAAARKHLAEHPGDTPMVVLATAHPAKFPVAMKAALGHPVALPDHLADLHDREELYQTVAPETAEVQRKLLDFTSD